MSLDSTLFRPNVVNGGLINVQVITATGAGTYTPTVGTDFVIVEGLAGGGGGGAIASPGGGNSAVSAGGGAGGYFRKKLLSSFSGATYSVGAKGTGGAAGAHDGNTGSNTTFTDTLGTVYTANGGVGGGRTTGGPSQVVGVSLGGTATNGDLNIPGGNSIGGACWPGPFFGFSGQGGSSVFGSGGAAAFVAANPGSTAGINGTGKGSGGSGAVGNGATTDRAGGDGTDGQIIIWEYRLATQPYSGQFAGARVDTDETQGAGSGYADLATAGPSVTLNITGTTAIVHCSCVAYKTGGAGNSFFIGVAISGATTRAAADLTQGSSTGASLPEPVAAATVFTGLTPGSNTFKLQYRNDGGTTWHFFARGITVIAI